MRYFAEIAYNGTRFVGWQLQPNGISVQAAVENAFSTLLNQKISVTGCGRTDAGVHASKYFLHLDFEGEFPNHFIYRINKLLGNDIALNRIFKVPNDSHARFDATKRSYVYKITFKKNPFFQEGLTYHLRAKNYDIDVLNSAAALLLDYDAFAPFCKTHSDAKTMLCTLYESTWKIKGDELHYHISANRFLRGMVRLIVGMSMFVAEGKMTIEDVKKSLDNQTPLPKAYSAPPQGLYLCNVKYPFFDCSNPIC